MNAVVTPQRHPVYALCRTGREDAGVEGGVSVTVLSATPHQVPERVSRRAGADRLTACYLNPQVAGGRASR